MNTNETNETNGRRMFIGKLAAGAATAGLLSVAPTFKMFGKDNSQTFSDSPGDPEAIFKKLKGNHRVVFDAPRPHEIMPFVWPLVFLVTNEGSGTPKSDCGVLVVLRHDAICYAMEDRLWEKYKFGEFFKANDPETGKPSTRNPFWKPKPGAFKVPGFGEVNIGVDQLQGEGVLFCVCDAAMTVNSAAIAGSMNMDAAEVKKDWVSGLLPGIQPVPSGVWALGRAQEYKCAYVFAG